MSKSKRSGPDALEMGGTSKNRKKVDQYGFTMHAKEESEENLKEEDSNNRGDDADSGVLGNINREGDVDRVGRRNDGKIVQTRSVTVAYDQVGEGEGGTTAATRWAAV